MAAPQPEKSDQASKVKSPPGAPAAGPGAGPNPVGAKPAGPKPVRPGRRVGGFVSKLLFSAVALLILLGVAGYGALILRDKDPRIGAAADYVDKGLSETDGLFGRAKGLVAGLTGSAPKPETPGAGRPLLDKAPLDNPPLDKALDKALDSSPDRAAEAEKTPEKSPETRAAETPTWQAPQQAAAPEAPAKPAEEKLSERPAAAPAPVDAEVIENRQADARTAPAASPKSADADGFTDRDLIYGLEGRLDAMSDELRTLREKLDAPKNETRAAPETDARKPAPAPDASAAAVVLAFALQRELEAGRPFAAEVAAFSRLGGEPAPAPVLVEVAEKGAPTGPALREEFAPIAKKLKAHEAHGGSGALTDHLIEGASKLVKVRPTGEAQPETLDGKLDRLEAALAHNDFAAALGFFDSLPQDAQAEAAAFGARLRQRAEAAKAADELLSGAIAALGKK